MSKITKGPAKKTTQPVATPNTTVHKFTVEIHEHPRDMFYVSSLRGDHSRALLDMLTEMTPDELELYSQDDPSSVFQPAEFQKFLSEIETGDIVGINTAKYKILSKMGDLLVGRELPPCRGSEFNKLDAEKQNLVLSSEPETLTSRDISLAVMMNMADILYRNGKPYGMPDAKEFTVNFEGLPPPDTTKVKNSAKKKPVVAKKKA